MVSDVLPCAGRFSLAGTIFLRHLPFDQTTRTKTSQSMQVDHTRSGSRMRQEGSGAVIRTKEGM